MITKNIFLALLLFLSSLSLLAKGDKDIALVLAGKAITKGELKQKFDAYNAPLEDENKGTITQFLEGYVFQTLVEQEAHARRIDTTASFKREIDTYRLQLTNTYLADTITEPKLADELLKRLDRELKVNQVFIPFDSTLVFAKDTIAYYQKALEMRKVAMKQGFDKVEKADKPFSFGVVMDLETETGELGWIKPFIFSFKLESVLYAAKLNAVSMPIRSAKGYHVLQVTAHRPAQGNPIIEQVIFNFPSIPASKAMQDSIYNIVSATYNEIQKQKNFQLICNEYAVAYDRGENGCLFGEIGIGEKIPLPLIQAAFELKQVGEVSKPILTPYGWHILRLKEKAPLPSIEASRASVMKVMNSDKILPEVVSRKGQRLRKLNKAKVNAKAYQKLFALTDKFSSRNADFAQQVTNGEDEILKIDNRKSHTVAEFLEYIDATQMLYAPRKVDENPLAGGFSSMLDLRLTSDLLDAQLNGFVYAAIMRYEKETLEEKNPKFAQSMQKLSEDLMFTKLLEEEIWRKSRYDVEGLRNIFEKNKANYTLEKELFKGCVVFAREEQVLKQVEEDYKQEPLSGAGLRRKYNNEAINIQVEEGLWDRGDNKYLDAKLNNKTLKSSMQHFPYYTVLGRYIDVPEEYTDVKFQVEADYQQELEQQFETLLKEKYEITINQAVIEDIK